MNRGWLLKEVNHASDVMAKWPEPTRKAMQHAARAGTAFQEENSMLTPQDLRDLADGLANQNSTAELLAEVYADAPRVKRALEDYARLAVFHGKSNREIQADLEAIAGKRHVHMNSIGKDECFLCKRDLRDPIHRVALGDTQ